MGKGFHDGTFQGMRYFTCAVHSGLFVKKHQIIRKMAMSDFVLSRTPKTPKSPKKEKVKKLGPRDIGRIKGWKPSRDIYKNDEELKAEKVRKNYRQKRKARNKRSSLTDIEHELSNNGSLFKSISSKYKKA